MTDAVLTLDLAALAPAIVEAADSARVGISVTLTDLQAPRVVFINEAGASILGYTREEITAMSAFDIIVPDQREAHLERRAQRRAGAPLPNWIHATALTKDGRRVPIDVGLAPITIGNERAMVAFFLDVTQRQEALDALARSESRFRTCVENAPEAVWIVAKGRLVYANPETVRLLGYEDVDSVLALSPSEIVHPDEVALMHERIRRMLEKGAQLEAREYRARRADGRFVVVEVQSIRIDWQGTPAILCFGRDTTVRKEMEARLVQADRLASLGTMVAGIAHEINNPLTYTLLGLEQALALLDGGSRPAGADAWADKLRASLHEVQRGAERVAGIVRELRAFARPATQTPQPVDLAGVVNSAIRFVQNEVRHRARLDTHLETGAFVKGVAPRLEQVFVNLLVNAAQALPEERASENRIAVRLARVAEDVVAEVEDNGAGMPEDVVHRIFDPYFTTKSGGGLGLGLSISHSIVTSHGGQISVESQAGRGTRFRISLPALQTTGTLRAEARLPAAEAPERPAAEPESRRRLLVVDDEPLVGRTLANTLSARYHVHAVNDVGEALAYLSENLVDVILCDLMMPGRTGVDLLREVEKRHPPLATKIVFMTGGAFSARSTEFIQQATHKVIEKPFTTATLLADLDKI